MELYPNFDLPEPNTQTFDLEDEEANNAQRDHRFSSKTVTRSKRSASYSENITAHDRGQFRQQAKSYSEANVIKQKLNTTTEDVFPDQPKLTLSTEKLKEFLMTHADFLDSLYEKKSYALDQQEREQQEAIAAQAEAVKALPAELWWVPPIKLPTSRSLPSVARSNYSAASSTSTSYKTRRSVDNLRQRVNSVCDLIEAMGILDAEQPESSNEASARSTDLCVPLLNIPSIASQSSSRNEALQQHTSYKTVASQCTVIEPNISSEQENNQAESATLRKSTSQSRSQYSSPPACNAVRVAALPQPSEVASQYATSQSNLSVSDLACIHIVNPMLSKLARLCTAQGQQYLTVLEELEKACNDFHNACKFQGASK